MDAITIGLILVAALVSAAIGSAVAWRVANRRAAERFRRDEADVRDQMANGIKQLRAVNTRLQAELDNEKTESNKRLLALSSEQRGSITRLEGQLRFAYAELDRLNAGRSGTGPESQVDEQGFAVTRPYSPR